MEKIFTRTRGDDPDLTSGLLELIKCARTSGILRRAIELYYETEGTKGFINLFLNPLMGSNT